MPFKVSLSLRGDFIPIVALAAAMNDLSDLLAQLDVSISGKERLEWGMKAMRTRNAVIEAIPRVPNEEDYNFNMAHKIIPALLIGTKAMGKKPVRPEFFSDGALDSLKDLATIANGDVRRVFITGSLNGKPARPIHIKPTVKTNVDELIGPRYSTIGSVEGNLDTVSLHRSPRIFVYHAITHKAVRCRFNMEMMEQVRAALGKRVIASGTVHYNRQGEPIRVDMERLRVLGQDRLPTTADMTGTIEWPEDVSTDEFIRSIRGG